MRLYAQKGDKKVVYKEELKKDLLDSKEFKNLVNEYDEICKKKDEYWENLKELKPKDMEETTFHMFIQEARYEKKLTDKMITAFYNNKALECKELIFKGADREKLFEEAERIGGKNLTMVQGWLLKDLHNIRKQKHYPYTHDREISEPRILREIDFEELLRKHEEKEEFMENEKDFYLIEYGKNTKYFTTVDNSTGELFTEDFDSIEKALKFIKSSCNPDILEEIREKETRYKVSIYETKEDWEQGEPFVLDSFSDLEEADKQLTKTMKRENYYSGLVLDTVTGIEERAYYSDEMQEDIEDEEDSL